MWTDLTKVDDSAKWDGVAPSAFTKTLGPLASAADWRTALGVSGSDPELTALAGLTSAADKGIHFTGSGTAATHDLSAFSRTLLAALNQAAWQATLGLVPGTNVQAFDAELAALAGLASAADKLPYFTGAGTAALADLTGFSRTLLDDVDASAWRSTLGLGTIATQAASNVAITGGTISGLTSLTTSGNIGVFSAVRPTVTVSDGVGSATRVFQAVDNQSDLFFNASFDGSNWNLDDIALNGFGISMLHSGVYFSRILAGANPRTLLAGIRIDAGGDLGIGDFGGDVPNKLSVLGDIASYALFSDASNYERLRLFTSGSFSYLATEVAGTGAAKGLGIQSSGSQVQITTTTAQPISLLTANTIRWQCNGSGHFLAFADNTYDIGAVGATRPRSGYFGTSVNAVSGAVLLDTNGVTLGDAKNIIANATTGTKIGTATTQKLSFWNAAPVVQPTTIADADGTLADATTKLNSLLAKLESIGLLAAA